MRWDALFADLEAQLETAQTIETWAEVAELARGERAAVSLADRIRAASGVAVRVQTAAEDLQGVVRRAGADWVLLEVEGARSAVLPLGAIQSIDGLPPTALPADATPVAARLGLAAVVRGLARDRAELLLTLASGRRWRGVADRVGADAFDLGTRADGERQPTAVLTIPFAAVSSLLST